LNIIYRIMYTKYTRHGIIFIPPATGKVAVSEGINWGLNAVKGTTPDNSLILKRTLGLVEKTCQDLGLDRATQQFLLEPKRSLEATIPVKMDDGHTRAFKGWRVLHTDVTGPGMGGISFHPEMNYDQVKALAVLMSIRCALAGLPLGGGKGGLRANPRELSLPELERLSRGYIKAIAPGLGREQDILAPGAYTNPQVMAWMADEFSRIKQEPHLAVATGKPLWAGGLKGGVTAPAWGIFFLTRAAFRSMGRDLARATVGVYGYRHAEALAARFLKEAGAKVVALCDSKTGIYDQQGIDLGLAEEIKQRTGSLTAYPRGERVTPGEVLSVPCDILLLASPEGTSAQVKTEHLAAKLIAELAPGFLTPEMDQELGQKGTVVLPDVLVSAGGVVAGCLEWVQNRTGQYWTEEEVRERMGKILAEAYQSLWKFKSEKKWSNWRAAAWGVAVLRIAQAMKARGWC
jgi:glutamate dehydrogenase/leucine dehydrogenase